jgi:hypothetical protein
MLSVELCLEKEILLSELYIMKEKNDYILFLAYFYRALLDSLQKQLKLAPSLFRFPSTKFYFYDENKCFDNANSFFNVHVQINN